MPISKLFIANRGEIAVRVIKAAQELGLATIQACSDADEDSLAARLADEVANIGPPQAAKSYLNQENILKAAEQSGADAVHPGYGFLSENADFADAVEAAGLIFVGPTGETIRRLGDKVAAREVAAQAGVPVVPGSNNRIEDAGQAARLASEIGYPVMIKAAAGGGGRGIRIVDSAEAFARAFPLASREAEASFGDGGLYVEKVIEKARHIEVQVLGDGRDVIHCFERECSLQRRRQKVWEEAPASVLSDGTRRSLCDAAVALAKFVGYRGAGTVEFLYDEVADRFYFIEMNTRIQVEHPVTECITGIDLVGEMIRIAGGEPLRLRQQDVVVDGHAIECRINAEDPANEFMPFPGVVEELSLPQRPDVRFDTLLYAGYAVPPYYDSLLGKLIVSGGDRGDALKNLATALGELKISGLKTTVPLHVALARDDDVRAGNFDTKFLERWLENPPASLVAT